LLDGFQRFEDLVFTTLLLSPPREIQTVHLTFRRATHSTPPPHPRTRSYIHTFRFRSGSGQDSFKISLLSSRILLVPPHDLHHSLQAHTLSSPLRSPTPARFPSIRKLKLPPQVYITINQSINHPLFSTSFPDHFPA